MTFKIKIRTKVNKQWKWNKIRHFSMGHIQIWRHIIFNQKMLKHFNGFPNRTCSVLSLKLFSTGHNQIWRHIYFSDFQHQYFLVLWLKRTQKMEMKQNQIFSMGQIRIWYHFSMKNEEKISFVSFLDTFSREYSLTRAKITTIFRLSWKHFISIIKKHFKNILETSVLLWASKSCYRNWSFILNLCGVKLWCITMWWKTSI